MWFKSSPTEKALCLFAVVLIAIHQTYIYQHTPPLIDEVYSWLHFGGKGFWVSLTNYKSTNNHILYNITTSFWAMFVPDAVLAMRLTSIVSFWILLGYIFLYIHDKSNFKVAFTSLVCIGLGFSQTIFSVQGRGYMWLALCTFGLVCHAIEYVQTMKPKHLYYLVFWNVLGYFITPVFLYSAIGMYGFLAYHFIWHTQKRLFFIQILQMSLAIGGLVFLCYLPMLAYFGAEAFLASQRDNIKPISYYKFLVYTLPICLREAITAVVGLPKYVAFAFVSLVTCLSFYFKGKLGVWHQYFFNFVWISGLCVLVFAVATKVFPFYRILTHYAIFLVILTTFLLDKIPLPPFPTWLKTSGLVCFALVIFVGSFVQFQREIDFFYDEGSVSQCKKLRDKFKQIAEENATVWLSEDAFYGVFWLQQAGKMHLWVGKPCEAQYAVYAFDKSLPACHEKHETIWFLQFAKYKTNIFK